MSPKILIIIGILGAGIATAKSNLQAQFDSTSSLQPSLMSKEKNTEQGKAVPI
jgi:hypothetical protein